MISLENYRFKDKNRILEIEIVLSHSVVQCDYPLSQGRGWIPLDCGSKIVISGISSCQCHLWLVYREATSMSGFI